MHRRSPTRRASTTRARIRATLARVHRRGVLARTRSRLRERLPHALREHRARGGRRATATGTSPAELAREYPSVPFLALTPFRPVDAPAIARCAELDFADVLADGTDDGVLGHALLAHGFSDALRRRARRAARAARRSARRCSCAAWRAIVAHGGRPVGSVADRANARRHARAPEPQLLRRRRAHAQARDGFRAPARGRRAREESGLRSRRASRASPASRLPPSSRRPCKRLVHAQATALTALRSTDLLERFLRG